MVKNKKQCFLMQKSKIRFKKKVQKGVVQWFFKKFFILFGIITPLPS
jgi:hypothetical protein